VPAGDCACAVPGERKRYEADDAVARAAMTPLMNERRDTWRSATRISLISVEQSPSQCGTPDLRFMPAARTLPIPGERNWSLGKLQRSKLEGSGPSRDMVAHEIHGRQLMISGPLYP